MSDRIARAFNRSGATRAVALDISKAFDRVWHADLLHKLRSYGISGQIFDLVNFNTGKTQLVSFDWSNNTSAIDVKMDGSVIEEKSSFKMLGLTFSSKLDWGPYIISVAILDLCCYL